MTEKNIIFIVSGFLSFLIFLQIDNISSFLQAFDFFKEYYYQCNVTNFNNLSVVDTSQNVIFCKNLRTIPIITIFLVVFGVIYIIISKVMSLKWEQLRKER
ncbi:hypothetical protein CP985_14110 [Malaciobacter mytili LMG 24559]|uniref:Uncharacterized protein n=1 Tax=Malaciobacter mytili LMG 24559 TaxID=1032238 RepID=A0AAX2AD61_9BACT|nr:hypothetical protein [Malaciobacter mytili]AXH16481.1 putative membrane protein [Malaciobacter mytili LMG 24559]RXK12881.1 hypothetical protein CP985_14110 [Malaciobacter mytili LMG 24559]